MIRREHIQGKHGQVLLTCDECTWVEGSLVQLADYLTITHRQVCPRTGSTDANGKPLTVFH